MTPLERLLLEELPTGTFGHALPLQPERRHVQPEPWTPEEQAAHRVELCRALDLPHLTVVDETDDDEAAA